jgi:hypothetical protein
MLAGGLHANRKGFRADLDPKETDATTCPRRVMKNLETNKVMPKKKPHPVAKQFSDEDMEQIKRYGQALSGGVTPFDEEVERHLARYEANRKKNEGR